MISNNLPLILLLLCIPVGLSLYAKKVDHIEFTWKEFFIASIAPFLLCAGVIALSLAGQTTDVEVWNGQVISKDRVHGQYSQPITNCSGSGENMTCTTTYVQHYTVHWNVKGLFGSERKDVTLSSLDRTSRSVYKSPDPASYTGVVIGEPMSVEVQYTNYIQAVSDSLFNNTNEEKYAEIMPAYPRVQNHYKYQRVLNIGTHYTALELATLNKDLNESLGTLGGRKKVNIIVVLTNIPDQSYLYELQNHWLSGNINDVVVVVSADQGGAVQWADAFTYANSIGNELLQATLRDRVSSLEVLQLSELSEVVLTTVEELYDRPNEQDFEYLAEEVSVPNWISFVTVLLSIILSLLGIHILRNNNLRTPWSNR